MDSVEMADRLGLKETATHKYRIRRAEEFLGFFIDRLNKERGFCVTMSISANMLNELFIDKNRRAEVLLWIQQEMDKVENKVLST